MRGLKVRYDPGHGEANLNPPPACVSIDFDVTNQSRYEANRQGTLALVDVANRHGIPITWAVCGEAAVRDGRAYDAIASTPSDHEIGVHTYSHLDATASTREEFRADIQRCIDALRISSPRTFVFPWNRAGHFDVLRELGFRAFRGKQRAIGPAAPEEGLWNVRPVYYLDQKSIGAESLINAYLQLCVSRGGIFHLWSHPWSLVANGDTSPMMRTLDSVFARMAELREKARLAPTTMGEIATMMDNPRIRTQVAPTTASMGSSATPA
jgi:hypothetical protein